MFEAGSLQEEVDSEEEPAVFRMPGTVALRTAFLLLDGVDLVEQMRERACIMKFVPRFLRGNYRIAMRTALEEICAGQRCRETVRAERGWVLVTLRSEPPLPPGKKVDFGTDFPKCFEKNVFLQKKKTKKRQKKTTKNKKKAKKRAKSL